MKCKTCAHPHLQAIDQALLTRTHTLEALSQQYGLTVSSLHRHKQHLVKNLDRARDRLRNSQQLGQLLKLNVLLDKVERAIDTAAADGNVDQVVRGAGVGARIIKQMNRMEINPDLDTVHRIISNPQWLTQASLLPTDPHLITGIHQTIADIAFSPCPDLDPETISAKTHCSPLAIRNPELETPKTPPPCPDLAEAAAEAPEILAAAATRKPRALPPPHLRQTSAKLPKKISFPTDNNQENQSDNLCEKNLVTNPQIHNSEPTTQDSELYFDCIIPLKNERYRRGIF